MIVLKDIGVLFFFSVVFMLKNNFFSYAKVFFILCLFFFKVDLVLFLVDFKIQKNIILRTVLLIKITVKNFSYYYFKQKEKKKLFFFLIKIFSISMFFLVRSNNWLLFFVGWESMGIISFFLISWWKSRIKSNSARVQSLLYNRIGDFFLFLGIILFRISVWVVPKKSRTNCFVLLFKPICLLKNAIWMNII